jgi:hypothetical protein
MNIELLQGTLEVSENPGLETTDPRFSDIATLVQEGNYEEAAVKSEAILAEKIYDIRIIGYFLYGHFVEQGILPMKDICLCLSDLLSNNIDALGPARNRGKHIQTILNWLMRQLLKKLQYEEDNKSSLYTEWISGVSSDQVQEVLDAGENLRRALGPVLEDAAGPVIDGMAKINNWLQSFQRLVYREHEPEVVEEEEPESERTKRETKDIESEVEIGQKLWEDERKQVSIEAPQDEEEMIGVEGSYHLKLLMNKLQAFDQLISMRKFASAAIVADDINTIITNFDPRIYFPNLFVRFALQFAANIKSLAAYAEYKESAAWQALQELYKVDLASFVNFDPEAVDMGASGATGSYGEQDEYERMPEDEEG